MSAETVREVRRTAGGVVCRLGCIMLVPMWGGARNGWVLPKGGVERGEWPPQAAQREVEEETLLVTTPEKYLGTVRRRSIHPGYEREEKRIDMFLMKWSGRVVDEAPAVVDAAGGEWVDFYRGVKGMRYKEEADLLVAHRELILASGGQFLLAACEPAGQVTN